MPQLVTFTACTGTGHMDVLCQFERWDCGYFEVLGVYPNMQGPQQEISAYMSDEQIEELRSAAAVQYEKDLQNEREIAELLAAEINEEAKTAMRYSYEHA